MGSATFISPQMTPSEKVSAIARALFESGRSPYVAFTCDPVSGQFSYGSILIAAAELRSVVEAVEQLHIEAGRYE
jgi:hypothetical protein